MMVSTTDSPYENIIENAELRVFDLLHSLEWQLHSEKRYGSIWTMKCNVMNNYIYRYEGYIPNRSCAEVSAMIHPEGLHRSKWDSQSAGTTVVQEFNDNTSIILHKTHPRLMGLISARETVDLCKFKTDSLDGSRTVVMVSVENSNVPANPGVVRGNTYPTLLMLNPLGSSDTKITAILHADMRLKNVPNSVVDAFAPKGIMTFFEDLIKYAANENNKVSLNHNLTGWNGTNISC
ncbi:unnamed protein product [Caenorhabditis bovis]|uniref:START domain-containing protein n=1 Tax=Caenorhabditis bovis TaxID=2654633 RepID=A0A8S1EIR4_9PELO|nr:unnamed protein product [Caenorhabditis bovis]